MLSLPSREGGLNIPNPTKTSELEFYCSTVMTKDLKEQIILQEKGIVCSETDNAIKDITEVKSKWTADKAKYVYEHANTNLKRSIDIAKEKGASSWLTTLPIADLGFSLNKQEFRDAVSLRYNWTIKDVAPECACGKQNSSDHALVCNLGGYTIMRHNELRDLECSMLRTVCRDVRSEPKLIPVTGEQFNRSTIIDDEARPDISARDVWGRMDKAFFDVRITHPNAESMRNMPLSKIYEKHENEETELQQPNY